MYKNKNIFFRSYAQIAPGCANKFASPRKKEQICTRVQIS